MTIAREAALHSITEGDAPKPLVGVVVVRDGQLIDQSFRGETGEGRHAEFGLLERLSGEDLSNCTVFTTLEPCSSRNHPKVPCAQHLITAGVKRVVIGMYDPNPRIYRQGWKMLRDAGIELADFTPATREMVEGDNHAFINQYRRAHGNSGRALFDYTQNGGRFTFGDGDATFETRWTQRGADSIYALDYAHHVALIRHARTFEEVDDPGALDWASYTTGVKVGAIVAFRRNPGGPYLLIRIVAVEAGPDRGSDHYAVELDFQIRR